MATQTRCDAPLGPPAFGVCIVTPQDFCPFSVPTPQFHFVGKPLFAEGESRTWDLSKLKERLLEIAAWYIECNYGMQSGPWYERRQAFGAREANLSDFIQTFQAVDDSDRFRTAILTRHGSDLSFNLVQRIIADLVRASGGALTIGGAEKLALGEVAERLQLLTDPQPSFNRRDASPPPVPHGRDRTENAPMNNAVNDLRLFCLEVRNAHGAVWFGETDNATIDRRFQFLNSLRQNLEWTKRLNSLIDAARRAVVKQRVDTLIQRFETTVPRILHMIEERVRNLPTMPARIESLVHNGVLCAEKELGQPASARETAELLAKDRAFDDVHIELNSLTVSLDELLNEHWAHDPHTPANPPLRQSNGEKRSNTSIEETSTDDLTDDEFAIFDELVANSAFGSNRRLKAKDIAKGLSRKIGERRFSEILASLVVRGFLNVKQGRHDSGYFLTRKGQQAHREFQQSKRHNS